MGVHYFFGEEFDDDLEGLCPPSSPSWILTDRVRAGINSLKMSAFDMGPATRVSPLIKTARWSLLLLGIYWGNKRWNQLKAVEDERRAYEAKMQPIWDADSEGLLNRWTSFRIKTTSRLFQNTSCLLRTTPWLITHVQQVKPQQQQQ